MNKIIIACITGIVLTAMLPAVVIPYFTVLLWVLALSIISVVVLNSQSRTRFWLLAFLMGCFVTLLTMQSIVSTQMPLHYFEVAEKSSVAYIKKRQHRKQDFFIKGVIASLPKQTEFGLQFEFYIESIIFLDGSRVEDWQPDKIRLGWYEDIQDTLIPGQAWQFQIRLKPLRGLKNPNGFDYQAWLLQKGYGATGYVRSSRYNQHLTELDNDASVYLVAAKNIHLQFEKWRFRIRKKVEENIDSGITRALFLALSIGDKQALTTAHWQVLKNTGTVHLLVVSGLHIGLFALLGYGFGAVVSRVLYFPLLVCPAVIWSNIGSLIFAGFYAGLSGFSLPAQRALIMLCCFLLAHLFRRYLPVLTAYLMALLLVLLWDPLALFSSSLYLSFGAVGFLLFCFSARIQTPGSFLLLSLFKTQWVVFVGLTPLLLFFVGEGSLLMPVVNFFAVPLVSFILLPLVLLNSVCLLVLPAISALLLQAYDLLATEFWWLLSRCADIGSEYDLLWSVSWGRLPMLMIVVMAVFAALIVVLPKGFLPRLPVLCLWLPLLIPLKNNIPEGEFYTTVLDVGQGLSVVVETQNSVLVYDTGNRYSTQFDIGRDVLSPFLKRKGYRRIDTVVISHGDKDHSGGLSGLLSTIPTTQLLSGEDLDELDKNQQWQRCKAGQTWQQDGVQFLVLSPLLPLNDSIKANNQSCVLKVSNAHFSVLLTGDIEHRQERRLVKESAYEGLLKADVLLAPHHGSQTSSSTAFLRHVHPQLAVVSAGYANRYGHPHSGVLERYRRANITLLRTDRDGAIELDSTEFSSGSPSNFNFKKIVLARRDGNLRFWHSIYPSLPAHLRE